MMIYCPFCDFPFAERGPSDGTTAICPNCGQQFDCADSGLRTAIHGAAVTVISDSASESTPEDSLFRGKIGHFEVISTLGAGGFGTVYLARDPELDRPVALKVPHARYVARSDIRERVRREARNAAQLNHPNIVKIHSVEQDADVPFIVYEYVAGTTLLHYFVKNALTFRNMAEIVRDTLRALEHAHSLGIIHRDVKLANILIDGRGTPRLADFGLSKQLDTDSTMTVEGQIIGTPAYMSPEQAQGDQETLSGLSDVYSMGVVLYVMLTGELPFRGKPRMVVEQVKRDSPRNPKSLNDSVPLDLETICQKAMEKEPWRRYQSAAAMADDLDAWLNHRPIGARHIGRWGRLTRWCQRNPVVASLGASLASLALVTAAVSTYLFIRENAALTAEYDRLNRIYVAQGTSHFDAQHPLGYPNPLSALPWLVSGLSMDARNPERETVDQMRLEFVLRSCPKIEQMLFLERPITFATFDPLGTRILTNGDDSDALIWDAATGDQVVGPLKHDKAVLRGVFSPDGARVATCSQDGTARIWNSQTGAPITLPLSHQVDTADQTSENPVLKVCFSPNGKFLATVDLNRTVKIWDSESGKPACQPLVHKHNVLDVQFSPEGNRLLAAAGAERVVRIWDIPSGKALLDFYGHVGNGGHVYVARISRDGHTVASGDNRGQVFLWNAVDGKLQTTIPQQRGWITDLRFSPGGELLAIATSEGAVSLWKVRTGQQTGETITHGGAVTSLVFSPQGDFLATAGNDGLVGFWDTNTGKGKHPPLPHGQRVTSLDFTPDARRVLTGSSDGPVRIWNYRTPSVSELSYSLSEEIPCAIASADGLRIAAANADNVVIVSRVDSPQTAIELEGCANIECLAFNCDATFVAAGGGGRAACVWNAVDRRRIGPALYHDDVVRRVALSHDGRRLVTLTRRGETYLWDAPSGKCLSDLLDHGSPVTDIIMNPTGREFATVGGAAICLWSSETGEKIGATLVHDENVRSVSFHPKSPLLLSAGPRGATLWSRSGGTWQAASLLAGENIAWAAFSPEGLRMVTVTSNGTAQIRTCRETTTAVAAMHHHAAVLFASFSPDGRFLLTYAADRNIRIWDVFTGFLVIPPLPVMSEARLVAYSPLSHTIHAFCNDGSCVITELASHLCPFEELKCRSELQAAHVVDAISGSTPLNQAQLRDAWKKSKAIRHGMPGPQR